MSKTTFITNFNRSKDDVRKINSVKFTKPSLVKKSLGYATDIKTIYENYCRTGKVPLNGQKPIYDENFVNYDSLVEAQNIIGQASSYFSSLPAEIRSQYGNSLEKFVNAVHSQDNFLVEKGVLILKDESKSKPVIDSETGVGLPSNGISYPSVEKPVETPATTVSTDVL